MRLTESRTRERTQETTNPFDALLQRAGGGPKTDPIEARRLQSAVERWEKLGAPTLNPKELDALGVPRRQHLAIVYLALSKKYPELVPHMAANSIAEGLRKLGGRQDPGVQSKLRAFCRDHGLEGSPPLLGAAQLSSVQVGDVSNPGLRVLFSLGSERVDAPSGRHPRVQEATLEISAQGPAGYEGKSWMVSIESEKQSWSDGRSGRRSLDTLGLPDLKALEALLRAVLPKEDADPVVRLALRDDPRTAALEECLARVRACLETKRGALREAFGGLGSESVVGEVEDKASLVRLAAVFAHTDPPRA